MTKKDPKAFENAVKSRVSGLSTIRESNPPLTTYKPSKIKGSRISWTISCTIFKRTPVISVVRHKPSGMHRTVTGDHIISPCGVICKLGFNQFALLEHIEQLSVLLGRVSVCVEEIGIVYHFAVFLGGLCAHFRQGIND